MWMINQLLIQGLSIDLIYTTRFSSFWLILGCVYIQGEIDGRICFRKWFVTFGLVACLQTGFETQPQIQIK